ncbi:FAD-dependent monooxygenase [Streptosporangiaceae bacterium NEAU-GS5]|nr:FAD-dependent monooxygenase [Streptosporangiaceae bacterium NEAU-GS5]
MPSNGRYDAVIVGARCAGAATALLLARAGVRVLLVDRADRGTDTLSTHALMRGGVLQLDKWGLLDDVAAAGTPPITRTCFDYGDRAATVAIQPAAGVTALYAPRRTVLDALLVEHAAAAGAEVVHGVAVTGLLWDRHGRVGGVTGRGRAQSTFRAHAPLVIGADGIRSTIAAAVDAPTTKLGRHAAAIWYTYVTGLPNDAYQWFYRPGATAGFIPTNDGTACVFAGMPADLFRVSGPRSHRRALADGVARAAPQAAAALESAVMDGPVRGWPGVPGYARKAYGPGWALVGDAGYFKDPLGTHGITQAFRDAELLAEAIISGLGGSEPIEDALARYERVRDEISADIFDATDALASFSWDGVEVEQLLRRHAAGMKAEVDLLSRSMGPAR